MLVFCYARPVGLRNVFLRHIVIFLACDSIYIEEALARGARAWGIVGESSDMKTSRVLELHPDQLVVRVEVSKHPVFFKDSQDLALQGVEGSAV